MSITLKAGDRAPEFSGIDQHGLPISSADLRGKKLVLYFYPKNNTPGCTAEACSLRDGYEELREVGYEVLGVSPDKPASHERFIKKHDLPFRLLADVDKETAKAYGAWGRKKFMGREYDGILRSTFLIDEEGLIEEVITKVRTKTHHDQIMELIDR